MTKLDCWVRLQSPVKNINQEKKHPKQTNLFKLLKCHTICHMASSTSWQFRHQCCTPRQISWLY